MEKFVFLLISFGVFINTGFALRCYQCTSDKAEGCAKGAAGNNPIECSQIEHPQILQFCISKTLYDKQQKTEIYVASCESFRKPIGREFNKDVPVPESIIVLDRNIQQCQSNATHEIKECKPCREDGCNFFTNSASKLKIFNFLYLPVLYYFVKFILN